MGENAEEADQLVERGAVVGGPAPETDLHTGAFKASLLRDVLKKLPKIVLDSVDDAADTASAFDLFGRELVASCTKKEKGNEGEVFVYTPEQSPDQEDPKDWMYMPSVNAPDFCSSETAATPNKTACITALDTELTEVYWDAGVSLGGSRKKTEENVAFLRSFVEKALFDGLIDGISTDNVDLKAIVDKVISSTSTTTTSASAQLDRFVAADICVKLAERAGFVCAPSLRRQASGVFDDNKTASVAAKSLSFLLHRVEIKD